MLNPDNLKQDILNCINTIFPKAFNQAMLNTYSVHSKHNREKAQKFAEVVTDQIAEPLAEGLASAIDRYIKSANVHGQIWTIGNKFLQKATIASTGEGVGGGAIPNFLTIT